MQVDVTTLIPYQQGCVSGSYDAASTNIYAQPSGGWLATVQNWYSPSCEANWNVTYFDAASSSGVYLLVKELHAPNTDVSFEYSGKNSPAWSNMVDGTYQVQACTGIDEYDQCATA